MTSPSNPPGSLPQGPPPQGKPIYKQNPGLQPTRHAPVPPGQQGTHDVVDVNFPDEDAAGHLIDQPDPQPPLDNDDKNTKFPLSEDR